MSETKPSADQPSFTRKVWITVSITALVFVLIWMLKSTFNVLLLILAGVLICLYFIGFAGLIRRKTGLPQKGSMAISISFTILLIAAIFWFMGDKISAQVNELSDTFPQTIENFKQQLNQSAVGQEVVKKINKEGSSEKMSQTLDDFFSSTFGILTDLYVVLFLGIFFTAGPSVYKNGFLRLIPVGSRTMANQIMNDIGNTLTKWLKGKLFAMLIVAVLTAIGLFILDVPMALALALIAGLLNFIPNFGPIIAMVPAVLIGLMQDTTTALMIAGLYILVQVIESNFITPQIQRRLISIPPALLISAQLFMGVFSGGWGLLLATPVLMILIIIIRRTYIQKQEGTDDMNKPKKMSELKPDAERIEEDVSENKSGQQK